MLPEMNYIFKKSNIEVAGRGQNVMSQKMCMIHAAFFQEIFFMPQWHILFPDSLRHVGSNCKCAWSLCFGHDSCHDAEPRY